MGAQRVAPMEDGEITTQAPRCAPKCSLETRNRLCRSLLLTGQILTAMAIIIVTLVRYYATGGNTEIGVLPNPHAPCGLWNPTMLSLLHPCEYVFNIAIYTYEIACFGLVALLMLEVLFRKRQNYKLQEGAGCCERTAMVVLITAQIIGALMAWPILATVVVTVVVLIIVVTLGTWAWCGITWVGKTLCPRCSCCEKVAEFLRPVTRGLVSIREGVIGLAQSVTGSSLRCALLAICYTFGAVLWLLVLIAQLVFSMGRAESPPATLLVGGLTIWMFFMLTHSAIHWVYEWRYESVKAQSNAQSLKAPEDEVV